jgi:thiaminase/transcriptional activator TenA
LATYADPVFITYTNELLAHMERIAEGVGSEVKTKAMHGFDLSVRYEWMFWDQAWNLQSWPV